MNHSIFLYSVSIITAFFLLLPESETLGQFSETISTDRPGQANGAFGVGKSVLQVQTGPEWNSVKITETAAKASGFIWPATIRFGISEKIELRLNTAYSSYSADISGIEYTMIGARANILDGESNGPAVGVLLDLGIKAFASEDFKGDNGFGTLMVIAQQSISANSAITVNFGTSWNGLGDYHTWPYVLNFSHSLTDKLGIIVEHYGAFNTGSFVYKFDTGLGYLLTSDLLVDAAFGWGKGEFVTTSFVNFGVSWRFVNWRR
ncbi:transporter [Bacteroidota bacterium]